MTDIPDTRHSLIARLPDRRNVEAWEEFAAIYRPLVYRLARSKGMQDADAHELAQEVMVAVSRAVENWLPEKGRFRDWLFGISRNLMINFLTRQKFRPLGSGDSGIAELLENTCDRSTNESAVFDLEYRREIFHWAAERVQGQVSEQTWKAFWQSSVESKPIAGVAEQLGMTLGAVYIARSRVLARLRDAARRFEEVACED